MAEDILVFKSVLDAFEYQSEFMKIEIVPNRTVMGLVLHAWKGPNEQQYAHVVVAAREGVKVVRDNAHLFPNVEMDRVPDEIKELNGLLLPFIFCDSNLSNLFPGDFVCIGITGVVPGLSSFSVSGIVIQKAAFPPQLHLRFGWKTSDEQP